MRVRVVARHAERAGDEAEHGRFRRPVPAWAPFADGDGAEGGERRGQCEGEKTHRLTTA